MWLGNVSCSLLSVGPGVAVLARTDGAGGRQGADGTGGRRWRTVGGWGAGQGGDAVQVWGRCAGSGLGQRVLGSLVGWCAPWAHFGPRFGHSGFPQSRAVWRFKV